MIQRVYERAKMAKRADRVIVATDDDRIITAVQSFGRRSPHDPPRPHAPERNGWPKSPPMKAATSS